MSELKHIEINIWKACNSKCIFCMSRNVPKVMKKLAEVEYVKSRIKYYAEEWYNSIWFLWWDISIHPNIVEIIKTSKEEWFDKINIITNSMKFSDYDFARKVVEAWTSRVNISIHSHIHEIEDELTSIKWWLKKKLKAIDNLNELHQRWFLQSPLSINIVINKINLHTIVETVVYYFKAKNIKDIRLNFISLDHIIETNEDKVTLKYSDFLPYLKKIIYISLKYNIRITFDSIPPCVFLTIDKKNGKKLVKKFLWEQFDTIDQIEHVNVKDEKEKFKRKDKKKNKLKTKRKQCDECYYNSSCEWIRKDYERLYWLDEFNPVT